MYKRQIIERPQDLDVNSQVIHKKLDIVMATLENVRAEMYVLTGHTGKAR